jgi:hypothetical protein
VLLGRAFALAHPPSPQDSPSPDPGGREIDALWAAMQDVFIKGLFTEDPEIGAWYAAGILVLTCSETMRKKEAGGGGIDGKGKDWLWYNNEIQEKDVQWGWRDLEEAVLETESLPRDRTGHQLSMKQMKMRRLNYVPQEVLVVFDRARGHLRSESADLTSSEIARLFDMR